MIKKDSTLLLKVSSAFVLLIITCIAILSFVSSNSLKLANEQQLNEMRQSLEQSVIQTLQLGGENAADKVLTLLNYNLLTTQTLASIIAGSALPNEPLPREHVRSINESVLGANEYVSAIYSQLEPNFYDNSDELNKGINEHSTNSGTLEVYWVREGNELVNYPVDDANEKYDTTVNEHGVRAGEWYFCPQETRKPCALDPYLYEIDEGKVELVTTLSSPVIANGQFIGVVGVDINLPIVQRWIEEQTEKLFNGESHLSILSQKQLIVASTQYKNLISKPITQTETDFKAFVNGQDRVLKTDDTWSVKIDIPITHAGTIWTLVVSVPQSVALAPIERMQTASLDVYYDTIIELIVFSALLFIASVLISLWLSKSISRPIEQVSSTIQNLATKEGDLTQHVEVATHQELILLADGFNTFLHKIADMISSSKGSSAQLVAHLGELGKASIQLKSGTSEQQTNLEI